MNYRLLCWVLGLLLLLLSITMALCLAFAYAIEERHSGIDAVEAFGISLALTFLGALALLLLGRGSGREILRKEAIAIVGLGWIFCGIFGALPYVFCEPNLGLAQALFESISGFTTTGASVIGDLDAFPRSILLWRAFTQWLGGLGILVLFVALLTYLGVGSKALFRHESSAKSGKGLQARIRDVAARLWQIYLFLTAICCLGLWALGLSFYDALAHTFAAVSTGGFGTYDTSIAAFNSLWIELWLALFMVLGGISFMLYAWLLRGRWERWAKEEETKYFIALLLLATAVITADLALRDRAGLDALRVALFQVVSITTTSGFATDDFDKWPPLSRIVLLLLMALGGCAGSTAGGIKVSRWILFFKIVRSEVIAAFRPSQVISLHLNGNLVDDVLKTQTVFFIALAGVTVSLGTCVVSVLQPNLDMVSSFSSVVASLFNIGPGLRAVGPTQNYSHLSSATQVFLGFLMILGRLEFFAILVLFSPSLWRKY